MDTPTAKERWYLLCKGLGLEGETMWIEFESAYLTSGRAYHNLGHILDCLQLLDEHRAVATDPVAVELAVWFHDVV